MEKIKVLWIAYQPLVTIATDMGISHSNAVGGWLEGASKQITENGEVELVYCFPNANISDGSVGGIRYYSVRPIREIHFRDIKEYDADDYDRFRYIIDREKPNIIQIYGTEQLFHRQYIRMAFDLGMIDKTIVWIQGLVYYCAKCFNNGFTLREIKRATLWECIRGTNIDGIQKRLALNGKDEERCLKIIKNAFVRTEWDYSSCKAINPSINFFECNETLRKHFYEVVLWDIEGIERHSIFISQYSTPIKGFHMLLQALPIILREYPDAMVYTTGPDVFREKGFFARLRESSFEKIIREKIVSNHLEKHVKFLGQLDSESMRNRYVKSHVSVLASEIENSSNSVGEAMILGVPLVASDVGGISSLVDNKKEGVLYPYYEYALLAEKICSIFRDDEFAKSLSFNARKRATVTHDRELNYKKLIECYKRLVGNT